jgi:hypothetical protein
MSEWLVLLLLVPIVLVPVILLFGFAGCFIKPDFSPQPTVPDLLTPLNVAARPLETTAIRLSWSNAEPGATFEVERTKEGAGPATLPAVIDNPSFDDAGADLSPQGLEVGAVYFYRVRAVKAGENRLSEWSEPVQGATFIFSSKLDPAQGGSDQAGVEGACFVNRIPAPSPSGKTWPRVKITLRGSTAAPLTIDRCSISMPADVDPQLPSTSREPWDSHTDLLVVPTTEGPAGQSVILPAGVNRSFIAEYPLDGSRDVLIAFDISPAPGQGNVRFGPLMLSGPPRTHYKRPPAGGQIAEAGILDRASDFEPSLAHYLVESIEVV